MDARMLPRGAAMPEELLLAVPAIEARVSELLEGLNLRLPTLFKHERGQRSAASRLALPANRHAGAAFALSSHLASAAPFHAEVHRSSSWLRVAPFASLTASAATAAAPAFSATPAPAPTPPAPAPPAPAPPAPPPTNSSPLPEAPALKPLCSGGASSGSSASPHNNGSMWVTLACYTRKGHAPGYKQDNQDSMVVYETFAAPTKSLLAVFDGHGLAGHKVSSFIRDHLPNIVRKRLNDSMTPDDALASSFCSVNESMEAAPDDRGKGPPPCAGCGGECGGCRPACGFDAYNSGSTAVVSYLDGDVLTTAWAGDSRAVMGVERPKGKTSSSSSAAAGSATASTSGSGSAQSSPSAPSTPSTPASPMSPLASFFAAKPPAAAATATADQPGSSAPSSSSPSPASQPAAAASASVSSTPAAAAPPLTQAYGWHAVELTKDHKPDRPDERRRIMLYGGRVARTYSSSGMPQGPYRVWLRDYDYPGLAMSRALGDLAARPAGIICSPDVSQVVIPAGPRGGTGAVTAPGDARVSGSNPGSRPSRCFVVLASDGVWEFMSSNEVVDFVGARLAWQQERDQYKAIQAQGKGKGGSSACAAGAAPAAARDPAASEGQEQKPGLWGHRVALDTFRCGFGATDVTDPGRLTTTTSGSRTDPLVVRPWYWPLLSRMGWGPKPSKASTSAAAACRSLVDESLARWTREYGGQYIDDITVVVAQFEPL